MIIKTLNAAIFVVSLVAISAASVRAEGQLGSEVPGVLPAPPTVADIQPISINSNSPILPLSQLGEQVLETVCSGDLTVQQGLEAMPDLTTTHIQNACPSQLEVQSAQAASEATSL